MKDRRLRALAAAACILMGLGTLRAAAEPADTLGADLQACARIGAASARIACYDALATRVGGEAGRASPESAAVSTIATSGGSPTSEARSGSEPTHEATGYSPLMRRWELDRTSASGEFALRPHLANYILPVTYNFRPNQQPYPPQVLRVQKPEAKFQFSFKLKLLEDLPRTGGDLWLNYTQQSWWQVYNGAQSAPFRETTYRPGLSWVVPVEFGLAGLQGRALALTVEHQSNGRGFGLSRSWNRVAATAVMERGPFAAMVSAWVPFAYRDDNPRITRYLSYGEVQLGWRTGRSTLSALIRNPLGIDSGRVGVELGWSFPLPFTERIRGYAQYYYGYGESLIDHDARVNRIGIGVSLSDWL